MTIRHLLSDVDMGKEEALAVAEVIRSKWLSLGPRTAEFEHCFAQAFSVKHAVALSNCTAALHLALMGLDVGPGDEVLLPSYTFVATANAVLYQGATPVFVDIMGEDDLNLAADDLESKISTRSKAIIVVHLAGFPAGMDRIMTLAQKNGLSVVEDACHAIGATFGDPANKRFSGRKAGTVGDAGCFSFFANKNLVTGEGGMLVTDDEALASRVRLARSHGMTKSSWDKAHGRAYGYDVVQLGYNYRCTELTSALGLIQLSKLPHGNAARKRFATSYRERLTGLPGISIPFEGRLEDSAHHIFPILLEKSGERPRFRESLDAQGIQSSVHYPPVHEFSHYLEKFPNQRHLDRTEDVAAREVTLPLHPLLTERGVQDVCAAVEETVSAAL